MRNELPTNTSRAEPLATSFSPAGTLPSTRVQIALLVAITLLAALLRFYKLGAWSFWGDEVLTVANKPDGFNFNIIRQSLALTLIGSTIDWLGVSEWSARLAPALIGILSVPILYLPIRKILGAPVALLSCLLLALSPWHIYWSQNARFYSLLLLFYTLALLTFYLGLEHDRPAYILLSLLFLGLAARERLLALFLIPVLGSYLVLLALLPLEKPRGFRRLRILILGLILGILLAAYFAWPYLQELSSWLSGFGRINNSPFWLAAGVVYYVRVVTVCLAVAGAILLFSHQSRPLQRSALLLSLNAGLPLLTVMLLATFHYTANRYVFITLTSWLILAAAAVVELFRHTPRRARWLAIGVLLVLLLDPLSEATLYFQYQNGNRDDWRAALALIQARSDPDDQIVTPHPEIAEYYLGRQTTHYSWTTPADIEATSQTVWFVEDLTVSELHPDFYYWLRNEAQLVGVFDVTVQARTFTMRVYSYHPTRTSSPVGLGPACPAPLNHLHSPQSTVTRPTRKSSPWPTFPAT